jgi:Gluconate 2-dehydrogenase subunit 3
MNRRTAVKRLSLLAGGVLLSMGGIKYYQLHKVPDLSLLDKYRALLGDLSDTIIPASDSPGAKEAGVGDFVIKMVRDCTNRMSQNNFIGGLKDLAGYAQSKYGKSYGQCTVEERTEILVHFEKKAKPFSRLLGKVESKVEGDPFFVTLKNYVVLGYCTSKPGATQALRYDFIPGKYIGVVALSPGQRAWATE